MFCRNVSFYYAATCTCTCVCMYSGIVYAFHLLHYPHPLICLPSTFPLLLSSSSFSFLPPSLPLAHPPPSPSFLISFVKELLLTLRSEGMIHFKQSFPVLLPSLSTCWVGRHLRRTLHWCLSVYRAVLSTSNCSFLCSMWWCWNCFLN